MEQPARYEESRSLVPASAGVPVLLCATLGSALALWNAARGSSDVWLSLPGMLAFLAIGLTAVLARLRVAVFADSIVVGNSPSLSRVIPLIEVVQLKVSTLPRRRFRFTWPLSRYRVYTLRDEGGVEVSLRSGEIIYVGSESPYRLRDAILEAAPHLLTERQPATVGGAA